MFKKASLQLAALAVLLFALSQVSGGPVSDNKDGIEANATGDARIKPSNSLHFNRSWSLHSRPSVTDDKEGRVGDLRKKIDSVEKIQNSINEILKNLSRVVSALKGYCAVKAHGKPMAPTLSPIPDFTDFLADKDDGKSMVSTPFSIPDFASFFADKRDGQRTVPALSPVPDFADARIRPSHLLNFNHSLPFPLLPSVTHLLGGANNKEDREGDLKKRVDALEKMQKSINEIVMKLNHDISALTACCFDKGLGDPLGHTVSPVPRIRPIHHNWSFPLLSSVTGGFNGADKKEDWVENLRNRVDALEKIQKTAYETLKSVTRSVSVLAASCADKDKPMVPPASPKPDITPTTDKGDRKPMVTTPSAIPGATPSADKDDKKTMFPTLPSIPDFTGFLADKDGKKPMFPTLPSIPDFTDFLADKDDKKPMVPTVAPMPVFPTPHLPAGILPPKPKAVDEADEETLLAVPLQAKGNATPNLSSGGSSTPEIPEKIVIASTSLEDSPGENPFGSIPS